MNRKKEYSSVNWHHHMSHVKKSFHHLLSSSDFVDVTIWCEGKKLQAHKLLLSACSKYFYEILKISRSEHTIVILAGVKYSVLNDILHFIYNGEVSVDNANLDAFLDAARMLQISGLTGSTENNDITNNNDDANKASSGSLQKNSDDGGQSVEEGPKKLNKRRSSKESPLESELHTEKILKTETENNIFLSDIKCEPTEMVVFEDPLEDPLQSDQFKDNVYASGSCTQNFEEEVDMKRDSCMIENEKTTIGRQLHRRPGKILYFNGFKYAIDKKDVLKKKGYWRCILYKKYRCTGRLIADFEDNVLRLSGQHTHLPI